MKRDEAVEICEKAVKAWQMAGSTSEWGEAITTLLTVLKEYEELEAAIEPDTHIYFKDGSIDSIELCRDGLWRSRLSHFIQSDGTRRYTEPGGDLLSAWAAVKEGK